MVPYVRIEERMVMLIYSFQMGRIQGLAHATRTHSNKAAINVLEPLCKRLCRLAVDYTEQSNNILQEQGHIKPITIFKRLNR